MPRDYHDDYNRHGQRDRSDRYNHSHGDSKGYDQEYDTRNYQSRSKRPSDTNNRSFETLDRMDRRLEREDSRYFRNEPRESLSEKELHHKTTKRKSRKHKRKHSREREERKKRPKQLVDYDYDDVSSSSDTYSAGDLYHSPESGSSRLSPDGRYKRGESPASAIKSYQKHLKQRGHSNSPAHRSPNRTSSRLKKDGRISPESYPKSYSAPRAYRSAEQSPSPTRRYTRYKATSPWRQRSPGSPYSRFVKDDIIIKLNSNT